MAKQYKYAVSACLCGVPCRYDGKSKPNERAVALYNEGAAILVCPEQLGGLSTPRPPCEIVGDSVISSNGTDCTEQYTAGAQKVLELCRKYNIKKAILKQNSPSCGTKQVYDGTFTKTLISGEGITAKLLKENGIEVVGEERL